MSDGSEEFRQEEVERDSQKETDDTHEMLSDDEDQKNDGCRELQGLPDDPRIEEIPFERMDDEEHGQECRHDAPTGVFYDSGEEDGDAADKDSEYGDKAGEKGDASESQEIGEYIVSVEAQLAVEEPDDDESDEGQDGIRDGDFPLRLEYEAKASLDLFEDDAHITVKEGERPLFELREVPLDLIVFEEPDKTQYIGEKYLEEYAADAQKFAEDGARIRGGGYDAHEIPNLVGEVLPLAQRILDSGDAYIDGKTLRERLQEIDHVAREGRSDIADGDDADTGEGEIERGQKDFFLCEPQERRADIPGTFLRQIPEVRLGPLRRLVKEVGTQESRQEKDGKVLCDYDNQYHTEHGSYPFGKHPCEYVALYKISHK